MLRVLCGDDTFRFCGLCCCLWLLLLLLLLLLSCVFECIFESTAADEYLLIVAMMIPLAGHSDLTQTYRFVSLRFTSPLIRAAIESGIVTLHDIGFFLSLCRTTDAHQLGNRIGATSCGHVILLECERRNVFIMNGIIQRVRHAEEEEDEEDGG